MVCKSTLFESLIYYWSKEYSRETTNVIAPAIAHHINKEKMDIKQLGKAIDNWLIENPNDKSMITN
jgi:hypothetical protein